MFRLFLPEEQKIIGLLKKGTLKLAKTEHLL